MDISASLMLGRGSMNEGLAEGWEERALICWRTSYRGTVHRSDHRSILCWEV